VARPPLGSSPGTPSPNRFPERVAIAKPAPAASDPQKRLRVMLTLLSLKWSLNERDPTAQAHPGSLAAGWNIPRNNNKHHLDPCYAGGCLLHRDEVFDHALFVVHVVHFLTIIGIFMRRSTEVDGSETQFRSVVGCAPTSPDNVCGLRKEDTLDLMKSICRFRVGFLSLLLLFPLSLPESFGQTPEEKTAPRNLLRYRRPAGKWTAALPLGIGRLGAMVFGTVLKEWL
jgi:hypothetical protein